MQGGLRRVEENGECHVDEICTRWEEEENEASVGEREEVEMEEKTR